MEVGFLKFKYIVVGLTLLILSLANVEAVNKIDPTPGGPVFETVSLPDGPVFTVLYRSLLEAVKANDLEAVKGFIKGGHDVNRTDDSYTPLHIAAKAGNLRLVKYLLKNGADARSSCRFLTPAGLAASEGKLDVVRYFIKSGLDNATELLPTAVRCGHLNVVQYLIEAGASLPITTNYNEVLHSAMKDGHLPVVKYLLSKWTHIDITKALHYAIFCNQVPIFEYLLEISGGKLKGHSKDELLHEACRKLNFPMVRLLIELGASVNKEDIVGNTPILTAVESFGYTNQDTKTLYNLCEILEYLVSHQADLNSTNRYGHTILDIANEYCNAPLISLIRSVHSSDLR